MAAALKTNHNDGIRAHLLRLACKADRRHLVEKFDPAAFNFGT